MHQERSDRCAACTGSCRRRWWSLAEQRSSACKPCSNRRRRNVPGGFFSPKHRNSHTHSHAAARRRRRRSALSLSRRPPRRRARGLRWSVARQPAAGPTEPRRRRWLTVQRRAFDWDGCGTGGGPVWRWRRRRRVPAASRSTTAATRTASAQQNERGRQRNVGLSSVPALCRPFKLSVPPCLETPCKYVKARPPSRRSFHYLFFFSFYVPLAVYLFFHFFPPFSPRPCACVNFFFLFPSLQSFRHPVLSHYSKITTTHAVLYFPILFFRYWKIPRRPVVCKRHTSTWNRCLCAPPLLSKWVLQSTEHIRFHSRYHHPFSAICASHPLLPLPLWPC